ncbi:dual specificity protein phosphatase 15 [Pelomyxa schiedti]|nr:dual specificity protein phosphatase 15 [Pelomyxa schiedti]
MSHNGESEVTLEMLAPKQFAENFTWSGEDGRWSPRRRSSPDKIMQGLFLGDERNAYDSETLKQLGVTHVLSVMEIDDIEDHVSHFSADISLSHIHIPDDTTADLSQHFAAGVEFIHKARAEGGTVLVHCVWGMSRSASIVIAYVMQALSMDFLPALRCVQSERPIVFPNMGFANQLQKYGKLLKLQREAQREARKHFWEKLRAMNNNHNNTNTMASAAIPQPSAQQQPIVGPDQPGGERSTSL